jgi:tetratricopeptide (TPR) repeat protein
MSALQRLPQQRLNIAPTLASAGHRDLVYFDSHGQVVDPRSLKRRTVFWWAGLISISVLGATGAVLSHLPGLALAYAVPITIATVRHRLGRRMTAGLQDLLDGRLPAARACFQQIARSRWQSRVVRASAWHNLGAVALREGDHAESLRCVDKSIAIYEQIRSPRIREPRLQMIRGDKARLLAQLGRHDEAWKLVIKLAGSPGGELIELRRRTTLLLVAFESRRLGSIPADLHDWSRDALGITCAELLLALLAWAYFERNDPDMARHLLTEASDRVDASWFPRAYPTVWAWMRRQLPA